MKTRIVLRPLLALIFLGLLFGCGPVDNSADDSGLKKIAMPSKTLRLTVKLPERAVSASHGKAEQQSNVSSAFNPDAENLLGTWEYKTISGSNPTYTVTDQLTFFSSYFTKRLRVNVQYDSSSQSVAERSVPSPTIQKILSSVPKRSNSSSSQQDYYIECNITYNYSLSNHYLLTNVTSISSYNSRSGGSGAIPVEFFPKGPGSIGDSGLIPYSVSSSGATQLSFDDTTYNRAVGRLTQKTLVAVVPETISPFSDYRYGQQFYSTGLLSGVGAGVVTLNIPVGTPVRFLGLDILADASADDNVIISSMPAAQRLMTSRTAYTIDLTTDTLTVPLDPTDFQGVFVTLDPSADVRCEKDSQSGYYEKTGIAGSSNSFSFKSITQGYADSQCVYPAYSIEKFGTYSLGKDLSADCPPSMPSSIGGCPSVAKEFDYTINSVFVTVHTSADARYFNNHGYCGVANWKRYAPLNMTGCPRFNDSLGVFYSVVGKNSASTPAVFSNNNPSRVPSSRPSTLDTYYQSGSFGFYHPQLATLDWRTGKTMPSATSNAAAAYYDGSIYVMGGSSSGTAMSRVDISTDITADVWHTMPTTLPGSVPSGQAIERNGHVFLFSDTANTPVYRYDVTQDTWSTLNAVIPCANLSQPARIDDSVYFFGCSVGNTPQNRSFQYDILSDTFAELTTEMPTARYNSSTAVMYRDIFVIGGLTSNGTPSRVVERYSISGNSWTSEKALPWVDGGDGYAMYNGRSLIYFIGTTYNEDFKTNVAAYQISSSAWELETAMPTQRVGFIPVVSDLTGDSIYIMGGEKSSRAIDKVEVLTLPIY